MIAKDGKPFDIVNIDKILPHEVEVIQFLRPNGQRRRMAAPVGEDYVKKAKNLILSVEELASGAVVIYGRRINETEEKEISDIAFNGSGDKEPSKILQRIIDRLQ